MSDEIKNTFFSLQATHQNTVFIFGVAIITAIKIMIFYSICKRKQK